VDSLVMSPCSCVTPARKVRLGMRAGSSPIPMSAFSGRAHWVLVYAPPPNRNGSHKRNEGTVTVTGRRTFERSHWLEVDCDNLAVRLIPELGVGRMCYVLYVAHRMQSLFFHSFGAHGHATTMLPHRQGSKPSSRAWGVVVRTKHSQP
jgi:hypothetical protein